MQPLPDTKLGRRLAAFKMFGHAPEVVRMMPSAREIRRARRSDPAILAAEARGVFKGYCFATAIGALLICLMFLLIPRACPAAARYTITGKLADRIELAREKADGRF